MTSKKQIWKCDICGNIIEVLHEGADALVCCGQPMKLIEEKTQDPEIGEKHVPAIEGKKVKIGNIPHPMTEEHYIEWIEVTSESGEVCKKFLKSDNERVTEGAKPLAPEAEFAFEVKSARAYCNLHGLWKS